jgi:hypothetical protein
MTAMNPTTEATEPASAAPIGKPTLRQRFKTLIQESGAIVLWVYFGLFAIVLVSTATAIRLGVKVDGVAGAAGTWGMAWLFTKLTQPVRIAVTLAVTPAIATFLRRFKKRSAPLSDESLSDAPPADAPTSVAGGQSEK